MDIILFGLKSNISDVNYFYSTDNKTFTEETLLFLNSNTTIYAYAFDNEGNKSNIVTKNLTINNPTNGTVLIAYYCSKSERYQTSSSLVILLTQLLLVIVQIIVLRYHFTIVNVIN